MQLCGRIAMLKGRSHCSLGSAAVEAKEISNPEPPQPVSVMGVPHQSPCLSAAECGSH